MCAVPLFEPDATCTKDQGADNNRLAAGVAEHTDALERYASKKGQGMSHGSKWSISILLVAAIGALIGYTYTARSTNAGDRATFAAWNEVGGAVTLNRVEPPLAKRTQPGPADVSTRVLVGLYVIDIARIDDAAHTYTLDFVLSLQWNDPRLADKSQGMPRVHGKLGFDDVWNPQPRILNQKQLEMLLPHVVEVDPEGTAKKKRDVVD